MQYILAKNLRVALGHWQTLKPELGQAPSDEHFLLEDNKYIADVLADFRERKSRDTQSKVRPPDRLWPSQVGHYVTEFAEPLHIALFVPAVVLHARCDMEHCNAAWSLRQEFPLKGDCMVAPTEDGGVPRPGALQEADVPRDRRDRHRAAVRHALVRAGAQPRVLRPR